MDNMKWLEEWYLNNCDGDWEHCYGIRIDTLDNPGWSVKIDLRETNYENAEFNRYMQDLGDEDWVCCFLEDGIFNGAGDPHKLGTIIQIFREWIESF